MAECRKAVSPPVLAFPRGPGAVDPVGGPGGGRARHHGCLRGLCLRGVSPVRILQSIASGLLGPSAYAGGAPTAALGLFLHFVIAFGAATAYSLASLKIPALLRHPVRYGLAFGVGVYVFMNYVVLPLSAFRKGSGFSLPLFVNGVLAVVLLVGLPIALLAARFMRTAGTSEG